MSIPDKVCFINIYKYTNKKKLGSVRLYSPRLHLWLQYSKTSFKYYWRKYLLKKICFMFTYILGLNDGKTDFSPTITQSSVSHDHSEIIIIFRFGT